MIVVIDYQNGFETQQKAWRNGMCVLESKAFCKTWKISWWEFSIETVCMWGKTFFSWWYLTFLIVVQKSDFNEFGRVKSKLYMILSYKPNSLFFGSGQDHTIRDRGCDIAISKSNLCVSLCKIVSWLTHLIMHWFLGSTETAAKSKVNFTENCWTACLTEIMFALCLTRSTRGQ